MNESKDCIEGNYRPTFLEELTSLINRHCKEDGSNTPDWILSQYLEACLLAFETTTQQRETWYGRDPRPSQYVRPGGGLEASHE